MPTITQNCVYCGKPFTCFPSEATKGRRYCSLTCRTDDRFSGIPDRKTPVTFTCQSCSKQFVMMKSYVTAYAKKFGHEPMYCSVQCSGDGRRAANATTQVFVCEQCGKTENRRAYNAKGRIKYYSQQRYCSVECKNAGLAATAEKRFLSGEVGRHIKRNGYVWLSLPANLNGGIKGEILEHRYVMEQHLGRKLLPEETVHHVNGDRQHNKIENLELFSSRHGPGQRVIDKIAFAIEMLRLYPDFAAEQGVKLVNVERSD